MLVTDIKAPASFDCDFYRNDKPYLRSDDDARDHFLAVGRRSGLKGSPACDLGYLLNFIRNLNPGKMLEIGPGCSPKLKGENVYYFDVKSKEELDDRYHSEPGGNGVPEKIHYVDGSGNLGIISDKFDVVFSSHAIEHVLDLVNHLTDVENILEPGGVYVVVAPNKNFTFDYFKPISVVEDVIANHFDGRRASPNALRSVLLEELRRAHNDPARHWAGDHGEPSFEKLRALSSIGRFEDIASNDVQISGYHKWIFTDESFVELVNALNELDLISLKVHEYYNTPFGGMSFSAVLGR